MPPLSAMYDISMELLELCKNMCKRLLNTALLNYNNIDSIILFTRGIFLSCYYMFYIKHFY
jgi:hypothetical protein